MTQTNPDRLLTINDLAERFMMSRSAIVSLINRGKLPPHLHVFNGPRWRSSDIDAWTEKLKKRKGGIS